jgi:hypothetical protein
LYNKHYSEPGNFQPVDRIIEETKLTDIKKDIVYGEIPSLNNSGFIRGSNYVDNRTCPQWVIITDYGIQTIYNVTKHIIKEVKSQQNNEIVRDKIKTISGEVDPKGKVNELWQFVNSEPQYFACVIEKELRIYLSD